MAGSSAIARRSRTSLPPALVTAIVATLLALHWWLGVSALIGTGVTNDEPIHITSGYCYWHFNDYRMQPENGNLPQRWAALPLLTMHPYLDPAKEARLWHVSQQWNISNNFLFRSGNDADYMVFCARAAMALWTVATGLLVFCWSRRLWGDVGGIFSLALYVVSPTTLAQGPLATSDMCAAFWLVAAVGAWWRASHDLKWSTLLLSCAATGLAFVAKFSAVLLVPIFVLLILWQFLAPGPLTVTWRGRGHPSRSVESRVGKAAVLGGLFVAHAVAAWAIIWTFFGWRYSAFSPVLPAAWRFYLPTGMIVGSSGLVNDAITEGFKLRLFPQAFIHGFAHVRYQGESRGAFLLGHYSNSGWWWFFPYAFLVKSTLGEVLVTAALVLGAALRWTKPGIARGAQFLRDCHRLAPLLTLGAVYWTFSLMTALNIGQRHILPMYPVLFILAGALMSGAVRRWLRGLAVVFLLCSVAASFWIRPHYLAFFNVLSGGPSDGWRQLVDSSLDWGQDLPALARWVHAHRRPGETVYLSYFGAGNPAYEGLGFATELSPYYTYGRKRRWVKLGPGLYCISATLLQDVYSPIRGPWTADREGYYQHLRKTMRARLAAGTISPDLNDFGEGPNHDLWVLDRMRFARLCTYLRLRRPDAVINYSIFVYRLSAHEVHVVVDGTAGELGGMMQQAITQSSGRSR